ncbi:MAG: helix-turn-helix domain-containing protein [Micropruina sp.]|uniref:AraC family transcriptional regulator n=1 Tax=Micropruina sp. TaxID=2737536 RepID=UPI0039E572A9
MAASTNATGRLPASKGLLRPEEFAQRVSFDEVPASGPAARWVERVWSSRWDLPEGSVLTTSLLPHPAVELTIERGELSRAGHTGDGVWLTGVVSHRFDVTLRGRGGVVGMKFRSGGFTAWSGVSAHRLTDRVVPAAERLADTESLRRLELSASDSAAALRDFVEQRADAAGPIPELVDRVMTLLRQPALTRVDALAERCDCSIRTLQRTLRRYVGVGPKWLVRRHRMHDAVAALDAGATEGLADLAARLGWYDQSQFARDFVRLVGVSPGAYRDRSRTGTGRAGLADS